MQGTVSGRYEASPLFHRIKHCCVSEFLPKERQYWMYKNLLHSKKYIAFKRNPASDNCPCKTFDSFGLEIQFVWYRVG